MSGRTEVVTSDRPLREETPAGQRPDPSRDTLGWADCSAIIGAYRRSRDVFFEPNRWPALRRLAWG